MLPLKDTNTARHFPFWVIIIIALNFYVFFKELTSPNIDQFLLQYSLIPALVNFSNPSTLIKFITSQFVHAGWLHILSNMWFLWVFGDNVEDRLGFFLFPIFYLISGIVGGLSEYLFIPNSDIAMLGASGAIAGVLGAYLALFPKVTVKSLLFLAIFVTIINVPAYVMLIYWIITQVLGSFLLIYMTNIGSLGGIAYFAHIGGFGFGWIYAKLFIKPKPVEVGVSVS